MSLVKEKNKTITIKVCMGSSCFANGNATNLDYIRNYVKDHNIDAKIETFGYGCNRNCSSGPNVLIDDQKIEYASPVRLESVLKSYR